MLIGHLDTRDVYSYVTNNEVFGDINIFLMMWRGCSYVGCGVDAVLMWVDVGWMWGGCTIIFKGYDCAQAHVR